MTRVPPRKPPARRSPQGSRSAPGTSAKSQPKPQPKSRTGALRWKISKLRELDTKTALLAAGGILVFFAVLSLFTDGDRAPRYRAPSSLPDAPAPADPGDVAGFRRDCVEGVLKQGAAVPASCRSLEAIRAAYRVDALDQLAQAQGKMVMTARRIVDGDILDDQTLAACIGEGVCAPVPLTPPADRAKPSSALSPESRRARDDFWRLANGDPLGPELCGYMDICRALYKSRLVTFPPRTED